MSEKQPAFQIIPDDKEFVERIASIVPLESADREALTTIIAGHRLMHSAKSASADVERQNAMLTMQNLHLNRVIHNLVTQLGGKAEVKDGDIPFDWNLEYHPISEAKTLGIVAGRCPPPSRG